MNERDLSESTSVVMFIGHSCKACDRLLEDLTLGRVPELGASLVVVSDDAYQARSFARLADVTVVAEDDGVLARVFQSDRTPQAFVIGADGRVLASGWPNDWQGVRDLVAASLAKGGDDGLIGEHAAAEVAF